MRKTSVFAVTAAAVWVLATAPAAGAAAETGSLGPIDYSVSVDETTGAVEVCLAGSEEGELGNELGSIGGSGSGDVCIALAPPAAPDTGIEDPASATVQVGIPTPEGVVQVDVGAFIDANTGSACVALSVTGPGVEPESIEVCVPPGSGELPELPELPDPGACLPESPNPDDLLGGLLGGTLGNVTSLVGGLGLPLPALQ